MFEKLDSSPAFRKLLEEPGPSPVLLNVYETSLGSRYREWFNRLGLSSGLKNVREVWSGSWFRACSINSIQVLLLENCCRNRVRVQFYQISMKPASGQCIENSSVDWVPVRVHKMFEKFGPGHGFVHVR
jgi:hypothetical protein